MRLFVGIEIDAEIRQRLASYVSELSRGAPEIRFVKPETWHVTLKFIGEYPEAKLDALRAALAAIHQPSFAIAFRNVGFFTPRSPRIFWAGVQAGPELPALAQAVDEATARLGVERETHPYRPHLTLARTGSGRPAGSARDRRKPVMFKLKEVLEGEPPPYWKQPVAQYASPDFGTMTAREFFLYCSKLSPQGASYTKVARFGLG